MLKASYINKGTASKTHDVQSGKYYYEVICGTFERHRAEGRAEGYGCNINRSTTSKSLIGRRRECRKGGSMAGSKVSKTRVQPSRAQNQPLGVDRTPNVESEETVEKVDPTSTAEQTDPFPNTAEKADPPNLVKR